MDLPILSMDRASARDAFIEYRTAVRESIEKELETADERRAAILAERRAQDEAIMAGYRLLSLGRQVLSLEEAIRQGGEDDQHRPRLAISRADQRAVNLTRNSNGSFRIDGANSRNFSNHSDPRTLVDHAFPVGTLPMVDNFGSNKWGPVHNLNAHAMVPIVPPRFRPAQLERYHLLWEVGEWADGHVRARAPKDPALLRALGSGLYVVLAIWDLTELERLVLGVRTE